MNASTVPAPYRSPRTLAKLVTATFLLYAVGIAWMSLAMIRGIGHLRDLQAGRAVDAAAMARLASQASGRESTILLMQLLGIIAFLWWMHRVAANLRAFGVDTVSPRSAVGSFFIPIVNLWKPYQVLGAIWIASTPPPAEPSYKPIAASPFLLLWWLTWTADRIAWIFFSQLTPKGDPSELISAFHTYLAIAALEAFALAMMFAVVWGLTRLQDRRASTGLAAATIVDR